eukprot:357281-Chlamydomonas_euryale.AAC.36
MCPWPPSSPTEPLPPPALAPTSLLRVDHCRPHLVRVSGLDALLHNAPRDDVAVFVARVASEPRRVV